jgi:hypothetical protein
MAMGLERAHAQFLGQGEGLLVVDFGLNGLWGLTLRRHRAEKPQGVSFVAAFLMGAG